MTWPSRTSELLVPGRIKEIGRPFQTFSTIGDRMPLEDGPEVDGLVPLGDDGKPGWLSQYGAMSTAARGETVAL